MRKGADLRNFDHLAKSGRLDRSAERRIFCKRQMRPALFVQVDNLVPIILNCESFSTPGMRGMGVGAARGIVLIRRKVIKACTRIAFACVLFL